MKYYKKNGKRKLKRRFRKRKFRIRKPLSLKNNFFFKRIKRFDDLVSQPMGGTPVPISQGYTFALYDLPNYTEFTNLFDRYRISCIVIKIQPLAVQMNVSGVNSDSNNMQTPEFTYAVDYTDSTAPATAEELYQYRINGTFPMTKLKKIKIYPRTTSTVYTESVIQPTSYKVNSKKDWYSCDYPNTAFYGFKIFAPGVGFANVYRSAVIVTYYLQFKDPR